MTRQSQTIPFDKPFPPGWALHVRLKRPPWTWLVFWRRTARIVRVTDTAGNIYTCWGDQEWMAWNAASSTAITIEIEPRPGDLTQYMLRVEAYRWRENDPARIGPPQFT